MERKTYPPFELGELRNGRSAVLHRSNRAILADAPTDREALALFESDAAEFLRLNGRPLFSAATAMRDALLAAEAKLEQHTGVPGVSEHVLPAVRNAIRQSTATSETTSPPTSHAE
jgi:hypothetical protein